MRILDVPFWLDMLWRDVRLGVRQLRRSPVYSLVTIAALSIGVGANIALFSLVNGWLIRPLDAADPQQLVRVTGPGGASQAAMATDNEAHISAADYVQYRRRNQTFSALAAHHVGGPMSVRGDGPARVIPVTPVSGNYFETLGVRAALGRTIESKDAQAGAREVAVLSHVGWRRHFDMRPDIVGATIVIDGIPHQVVGVLPESFTGTTAPMIPQIYRPLWERGGELMFAGRLFLLGRLTPGASTEQARADLHRIATQMTGSDRQERAIEIYPARRTPPYMYRVLVVVAVMCGLIVATVLIIACDNVAILSAIRAAARSPEIGVRLALGASRARIVCQLAVESALLCAVAGSLGTYLAFAVARFATQFYLPVPMPFALTFTPDWRVLTFAVITSSVAVLLCGLSPALKTLKTDLVSVVKGHGLTANVQSGLVTTQVALSTALLVCAAVLAHSVAEQVSPAPGLVSDRVVMTTVSLNGYAYTPERRLALMRALLQRVDGAPGVAAAAIVSNVPVANNGPMTTAEGTANGRVQRVQINHASAGLFRTLSIAIVAGTDFTPADETRAGGVGIVNESLARTFWPGRSPVGELLDLGDGTSVRVVGVTRDSEASGEDAAAPPVLYRPLAQRPPLAPTVLVKASGDPAPIVPLVRDRLSELDPELAAYNVMRLDDRLNLGLVFNRAAAIAGGAFGLFALVLGSVGIYGTMASVVQRRRREIGVRLALGASRVEIVRLISSAGMKWSLTGVAVGCGLGALAVLGLSRFLRGITPADPLAFTVTIALLLTASGMACYWPARRAARTPITEALRDE